MSTIPDPKYVVELANRLSSARDELAQLESEWIALFNQHGPRTDVPFSASLSERIVDLLEIDPARSYTATEVALSLSAKESSVASILSRLVKEDKLEKRGHSSYGFRRKLPAFRVAFNRTGREFKDVENDSEDEPRQVEPSDEDLYGLPDSMGSPFS